MAVNVLSRFVQMADSFWNSVKCSLYECDFESLVHPIHSKRRFIQKLNIAVLLRDVTELLYKIGVCDMTIFDRGR